MTSMLWVDDRIDDLGPWVEAFRNQDVEVNTASNIDDGITALREQKYDIVLLDVVLGPMHIFNDIPAVAAHTEGSKVFLVSGYFFKEDVLAGLPSAHRQSSQKFGQVDKEMLPRPRDQAAVRSFISNLLDDPYLDETSRSIDINESSHDTVFHWDIMKSLDLPGQEAAYRAVESKVAGSRDSYFDQGYVFLAYCNDFKEPVHKSKTMQGAFDDSQLARICESTGYAMFVYTQSGPIDDLTTRDCSNSSGLSGYPFILVRKNNVELPIHFDSGNWRSLVNYTLWRELALLDEHHVPTQHHAGDLTFIGFNIKQDGLEIVDATGSIINSTFSAFGVGNWGASRLAVNCSKDCTNQARLDATDNGSPICAFRIGGLVGRDFFFNSKHNYRVDGTDGSISFRKRQGR